MDGAGAGGAAPERRKQLTAAEAVNHKRQLAQMVERELALTGADSVTDFDDALQMVLVETAFGRYPKHLLDVYTGKVGSLLSQLQVGGGLRRLATMMASQ